MLSIPIFCYLDNAVNLYLEDKIMALCGFNQQMLGGLKEFSDGLFKQLLKRAKEDNLSIEESLKQELSEMDTFAQVLEGSNQEVTVMKGITLLAQGLYKQSLAEGGDNSRVAVALRYKEISEKEIEFCRALDEEYYGTLRPNSEDPHVALQLLAPWIEKYKSGGLYNEDYWKRIEIDSRNKEWIKKKEEMEKRIFFFSFGAGILVLVFPIAVLTVALVEKILSH